MTDRWLTLIGIGEDGRGGLSPRAAAALDDASYVVGGRRHLALAGPIDAPSLCWPSPIEDAIPAILARRGTPVAILATGDPFHFGVGAMLSRHVPAHEIASFPQPSAFSLAASRLCWSLQDVTPVSLHGREPGGLVRHIAHGARLLVLSWDATTPALIAAMLADRGFGPSRLTVLEAMGGPRERRREVIANQFDLADIDPLNTVAVECQAEHGRTASSLACLPDDAFEHDGQITKQLIRAATLAALSPHPGELLWDIGAGSGSVSIEWLRAHPRNRGIAVERRPDRAARAASNARRHGVDLAIIEGEAPAALAALPPPDAIFIGGGVSGPNLLDAAVGALGPGGRMVANAVTLEGQVCLTQAHATRGGELTLLQHAAASAVGNMSGWRPAMPVVQWRWTAP